MMDSVQGRDDALREEAQQDEVGDVEDAGETTAADTIDGPVNTKPVGADTMLKVSDTKDSETR